MRVGGGRGRVGVSGRSVSRTEEDDAESGVDEDGDGEALVVYVVDGVVAAASDGRHQQRCRHRSETPSSRSRRLN